ncbi:MAG: HEAT repeat domain-containing protein [Anaerolineae bacterium]|nr:HEAT repeat domain-containing protein [Anaerolineae bacterium]
MPKSNNLESQLAALNALRAAPVTNAARDALRKALAGKNSHVVAAAAEIVAENELSELEADLVKAFGGLLRQSAKADPGCRAKHALADALYHLESAAEDVFLPGARHVQMEPVWGGQADTAAALRGVCGLGLVRMRHRHALIVVADLLADPEPDARIAAARALGYSGDLAAAPLLRFKARSGDERPEVIYECFLALLKLDAETALPFVADFLRCDDPALAESAALALGESRLDGALDVLSAAWEDTFDADRRRILLLAIATLRTEAAIDYLLEIVRGDARSHAAAALEALRMYQSDPAIWRRVTQARAAMQ